MGWDSWIGVDAQGAAVANSKVKGSSSGAALPLGVAGAGGMLPMLRTSAL